MVGLLLVPTSLAAILRASEFEIGWIGWTFLAASFSSPLPCAACANDLPENPNPSQARTPPACPFSKYSVSSLTRGADKILSSSSSGLRAYLLRTYIYPASRFFAKSSLLVLFLAHIPLSFPA